MIGSSSMMRIFFFMTVLKELSTAMLRD